MAKARKTAPRRGASRAKPKAAPRAPVWLVALCGVVVGLFIALLFTLEPGRDSVKRDSAAPRPAAPAAEPPKRQTLNYEFYTRLPESEVVAPKPRPAPPPPPPPPAKPAKPPAPAAATTQYYLQAGSFRQRAEADRVRAQIILMGLDARLEDARLANGETWHRVQVGPFTDQARVNQAEQTLSGNGFNNLLRQQRSIR